MNLGMKTNLKCLLGTAVMASALGISSIPAHATDAYAQNSATLVKTLNDLFTVNNTTNTITVQGDLTGASKWYLKTSDNVLHQLLAFRSIYLVDPTTLNEGPLPSTTSGNGYVATTSTSTTHDVWSGTANPNGTSFTIYDDGGSGKGYGNGNYLEVGPAGSGLNGTNLPYGSFKFATPTGHTLSYYDIGLDYYVAAPIGGSNTGRIIFNLANQQSLPIPEPAYVQLGTLLIMGGAGLVLRRRKAQKSNS